MMTGAFSRNVGKLFSELELVTDNLFLHLEETLFSLVVHDTYVNTSTDNPVAGVIWRAMDGMMLNCNYSKPYILHALNLNIHKNQ